MNKHNIINDDNNINTINNNNNKTKNYVYLNETANIHNKPQNKNGPLITNDLIEKSTEKVEITEAEEEEEINKSLETKWDVKHSSLAPNFIANYYENSRLIYIHILLYIFNKLSFNTN